MTEYSYRWIRTNLRGVPEERHVKKMEAQGWEPVPPDELPPDTRVSLHWKLPDLLDPHAFGVEDGGLRLYRMSVERLAERRGYYAALTAKKSSNAGAAFTEAPVVDEPPKVYESDADPRSYREQLEAYYCFENLRLHPERVQELADYWANRAAKGLTFNPLGDANPDGSTNLAELRVLTKATSAGLPAGTQIYVKPPRP